MPSTVVVVNDDLHLASLLERVLVSDPRLVVTARARTPISALALAWESPPDALVVEQHRAGIQWWGILSDLRPYCPHACIVVLTDLDEDERPAAANLADHVLPRHWSWHLLADLLSPPVCEDQADPLPVAR